MFKLLRFSLFALLFVMTSVAALAQTSVTGAIGGLVKDPQGAVVPNAAATARNTETNKENTATADKEGRFLIDQLQPGTYAVTINAQGFAPFTQERVVVEVGRVTSLDVPLSISGTTSTVEVTAEAPVINTTQQDFSTNVNQTSINELPINGRRASNFVLLTPATVPDGNFGLISFRGISGLLNNSTIDGGDNNQAFFSEERGRTRISYVISQSAVREFQVNTSNYSAEYGRAAGGVVNTVTKSGTNEFHGSLFEYYRNNRFGARNPRAFQPVLNPDGTTSIIGIKPKDIRHQFGGTIGGRIIKDKLFFFFSYDQQKRDFPGLATFSDPGYLNTIDRSTGTSGLKNPSRNLTDAQINAAVAFLTNETGPVPRRGDQKIFLPKIDWHINQNNILTVTYNRLRWKSPAGVQTQPTNTNARASFGDDFVNDDALPVRLSSTISPTILNEFRFQYSRDNEFQFSQPPLPGEPTTAPGGRSPDVDLTGGGGIEFGKPTFLERRAFPDEKRYQFADTLTVTKGKHTLKFGGDINHVNDLQDNLRFEAGQFSYDTINDFIIDYTNLVSPGALPATVPCSSASGLVGRCYSSFLQAFGPTRYRFTTNDYNFFIQDDWRYSPKLTINIGLRYEYEQLPKPQFPNPAVLDPQRPDLTVSPTSVFPSDKNNFGPRIGFAYDVKGNGKMSFRGGYGIYYGRVINSTISNAISNTALPGGAQGTAFFTGTSTGAPVYPNLLPSVQAGTLSAVFFDPTFALPMIHQGDFVFEYEVARNTVLSVSYLGSLAHNLPNFVDRNLNPPTSTRTYTIPATIPSGRFAGQPNGPFAGQTVTIPYFTGTRPNPKFGALTEIRSDIRSRYNALVFQANRRLTNGLQFQASYTLSKATDNGQTSQTFTATNVPFNAFDQKLEQGLSNFDIRHKFVASAVYNPKFFSDDSNNRVGRAIFNGFSIDPIVSIYSGVTFTPTIGGSAPTGVFGRNTAGGINGSRGSTRFPLVARNSFHFPKIANVDLRISRRFRFSETTNLEFLAEGFNIFNRTQVTGLNTTMYSTSRTSDLIFQPSFGTISQAGASVFRERQVQFAVRFEF